jgi:hypothetical protein
MWGFAAAEAAAQHDRAMSARRSPRAALDVLVAIGVGVAGGACRFVAHKGFSNDQFIHLSKAQAWLAGESAHLAGRYANAGVTRWPTVSGSPSTWTGS